MRGTCRRMGKPTLLRSGHSGRTKETLSISGEDRGRGMGRGAGSASFLAYSGRIKQSIAVRLYQAPFSLFLGNLFL